MALTVKLLKGMGIEDDKIEAIIAAHTETVEGLTSLRDKYKKQAEQVPDLQKQLEDAKAAAADPDEWREKYEGEKKAFADFKASVEKEKAERAKAKAYRAMLEKAGVDHKRIESIMRVTDLSKVEMDGDGLKDEERLEEKAKDEWSDFIVKTKTHTPTPENPPKATGGSEGADPDVVKRLQARHERLYGKATATNTEE